MQLLMEPTLYMIGLLGIDGSEAAGGRARAGASCRGGS